MDLKMLEERAEIIRKIRSFFDERNYLELDTPLLAPDLIPESCLEVFETLRIPPTGSLKKARPYWLIPSPEIWMKKIISQHRVNVYQICKCFRNGESSGHFHSPEFTMLEYYTMDAGWLDSLRVTEELFSFLRGALPYFPAVLSQPFERLSIEEAFKRWAGFSLFNTADQGRLEQEARRLGLDPMPDLETPALYDLIFIHTVEPALPKDRPVVLTDYPAFVPCLAKKSPGGKTMERWELYAGGIELANCYSEETNPGEIQRFFQNEKAEKEKGALIRHRVDDGYWKIFGTPSSRENFFPRCSGVALGLDRLIMVLCGRLSIDGVLPFPMD